MSDGEMAQTVVRQAGRVLVVDPDGCLLLIPCRNPDTGRVFWITPGGGVKAGETHEQAAVRELWEETGIKVLELGPWVWRRRAVFRWLGIEYDQRERFFLCRVAARPEVSPERLTAEEHDVLGEARWWSAEAIEEASEVHFAPRDMGGLLRALLGGPLPSGAVEVG